MPRGERCLRGHGNLSGENRMKRTDLDFEDVWKQLIEHSGQTFYLKGGDPFTYAVMGNLLYPSRTDYHISKNDVQKAFELIPIEGPGRLRDIVRGPSYVWAILTDKRIINKP